MSDTWQWDSLTTCWDDAAAAWDAEVSVAVLLAYYRRMAEG